MKLRDKGNGMQGRALGPVHHHPSMQMKKAFPDAGRKRFEGELGPLSCFLCFSIVQL